MLLHMTSCSFLWLSSIPLYTHTTFCRLYLLACQWTLDCFSVLAAGSSAAVNTGLDTRSGMGLLDHMVVLLLVFQGTSVLVFTVTALIYISTKSVVRFPLLSTLANIF